MQAYMKIVQTTVSDLVPKVVLFCLVRRTVKTYMEQSGHFLGDVLKVEEEEEDRREKEGKDGKELRKVQWMEKLLTKAGETQEAVDVLLRNRAELVRVQKVVMETTPQEKVGEEAAAEK